MWAKTVDDRQHHTALEWTKHFFGQVQVLISEQQAWFPSVFTAANFSEQMVNVLLEVYYGMDPKLDVCIEAGLKQKVCLASEWPPIRFRAQVVKSCTLLFCPPAR